MKVKVLFFGVLAEISGTSMKFYNEVRSVEILKLKISEDFPEIIHYNYQISLNNVFIRTDSELKDGDEVAFLPPYAGG
jgi:sulfur-carrier protein